MASVFAQLEREMIGQRTREGLAIARLKHKRLGRPPGFTTKGSKTRLDPRVQRRILRERTAGATLSAIASNLNEDEIPTAHGGHAWHPATVRAIVKRAER